MSAITTTFGTGGANLTPGGVNEPTLANALRDIADDLATCKVALVTSDDATTLETAITLVNEIKTKLNAIAGGTLKTTKA